MYWFSTCNQKMKIKAQETPYSVLGGIPAEMSFFIVSITIKENYGNLIEVNRKLVTSN